MGCSIQSNMEPSKTSLVENTRMSQDIPFQRLYTLENFGVCQPRHNNTHVSPCNTALEAQSGQAKKTFKFVRITREPRQRMKTQVQTPLSQSTHTNVSNEVMEPNLKPTKRKIHTQVRTLPTVGKRFGSSICKVKGVKPLKMSSKPISG